jgi:uncharacterized protein YacL
MGSEDEDAGGGTEKREALEPPSGADQGEAAPQGRIEETLPPEPARAFGGRLLTRAPLTKEAHDRLTIFVVRAVFFLMAAGLGVYGVQVLSAVALRSDLDPFMGIVIGCGTAVVLILLEMFFSRSPIWTLSAIAFGLLMGLGLSLVFQFVVEFIVMAVTPADVRMAREFPQLLSFLKILTSVIFCYFGVTVLLQTKDDFKFIIPYVEFRKEVKSHTPLILDTSCFIDGRIRPLLDTGVFEQRLVVPTFVLAELQAVADSPDRSIRERGRRGLDILHDIEKGHSLEIIDRALRKDEEVDAALIILAANIGGRLVTTDYNLQKNARLQGIQVVNMNDVATALKPSFVPGETLTVRLLREGEDKGQAVGFLKDGTMVVVENARNRIGQEVGVEVTSSIQTNAGKMVFGKLRRSAKAMGET